VHGRRITKLKVFVDGHRVMILKGRSLRRVTLSGLPGRARHRVRVYEYSRHHLVGRITKHIRGCG
jgi:hypothetical protein